MVRAVGACLCLVLLGGCSSAFLAQHMVAVPNTDRHMGRWDDASPEQLARYGVREQLRIPVGPPKASLSVWTVEPRSVPRATVLVLHGYRSSKQAMVPIAEQAAAAGFRAVLVDLRGHGLSGGRFGTYGVIEARDLVQVVDVLESEGLLAGRLGVYGPSWGGAAALQLAALDERVRAVVAIATFTSMRDIVPLYVKRYVPMSGIATNEEKVQEAIAEAGMMGGFDPDQASPVDAVTRTDAALLFIHGTEDTHIPVEQSRTLHEAAGPPAALEIIAGADHTSIWFGRYGRTVSAAAFAWFDRWLVP